MNAINILKQDHRRVRGLFRRFTHAGERAEAQRQHLADQLFNELEVHTTVEQEIFYPAVGDTPDRTGRDLVLEASAAHDLVHTLIGDLQALAPAADEYTAKFSLLEKTIKQHIQEEERVMFPHAERTLTDVRLRDLGRQMADRKQALTAPSLIGESLRRAKAFIGEAVAAVAAPRHTPRRRSRSHKLTTLVTRKAPGHKAGHSGHGRALANRKAAHPVSAG